MTTFSTLARLRRVRVFFAERSGASPQKNPQHKLSLRYYNSVLESFAVFFPTAKAFTNEMKEILICYCKVRLDALYFESHYQSQEVQMKPKRIALILNTIALLDQVGQVKGKYRLGIISSYSTLPRATVDRYLKTMVQANLVKMSTGDYRCEKCRMFEIAPEGILYLVSFSF
jgi:hypothetical protein